MKVCVLTRGDLTECRGCEFGTDNPCSDAGLNCQKSAEAIVPRAVMNAKGRAERKLSSKLEGLVGDMKKAENHAHKGDCRDEERSGTPR